MSWVPGLDGYILFFNRDERRTRPLALAPSVRVIDGIEMLSPTDPEGGGSWVSVNTAGVTVALANRYHDTRPAAPERRESRGRLVHALASAQGIDEVERRLGALAIDRYEGFTLVVLEPAAAAARFGWNGRDLVASRTTEPGMLVASSAEDEAAAIAAREQAFRTAIRDAGWTRRALASVHTGHLPSPSALSVCMHRTDASTVSLTHVEVDPARVTMAYHAGQPCTHPPVAHVSLARARAIAGG